MSPRGASRTGACSAAAAGTDGLRGRLRTRADAGHPGWLAEHDRHVSDRALLNRLAAHGGRWVEVDELVGAVASRAAQGFPEGDLGRVIAQGVESVTASAYRDALGIYARVAAALGIAVPARRADVRRRVQRRVEAALATGGASTATTLRRAAADDLAAALKLQAARAARRSRRAVQRHTGPLARALTLHEWRLLIDDAWHAARRGDAVDVTHQAQWAARQIPLPLRDTAAR